MLSSTSPEPGAVALVRRGPHELHGQPLVLGFAAGWSPPAPQLLEALRRELRGLGAALLVFSASGVTWLRADDELEVAQGDGPFDRAAFRSLLPRALRYRQRRVALALLILDARGEVAWSGHAEHCQDPASTLARGLSVASRELLQARSGAAGISRRELLASLGAALALALGEGCQPGEPARTPLAPPLEASGPNGVPVQLTINGERHRLRLEPRVSLLDVLRERLGLTGTKKGCDHGQCGACTVLIDGRRVNACLTLAVMVRSEVTTIEGLADGDSLHPMQRAFVEEDALQCGYCTPGQIMSALGLVREGHSGDEAAIREHMSGNICRCGAYPNIVRAIVKAGKAST